MLAFEEMVEQFSEQAWFEISPRDWEAISPRGGSNEFARHNARLNRLVANKLIPWFQAERDIEVEPWPSEEALASIWEFVSGIPLTLDGTRVVIIPSETIDIEELRVPREWIDIPDWVASYYIAVQVEAEAGWLRVWGYATHKQLKTIGSYDPITETYALGREDIIEDLDLIWLARSLCPDEIAAVRPLPILSALNLENLLPQLSQPLPYSPRLEVEFEQWAALLANSLTRQQLYELRLLGIETPVATAAATIAARLRTTVTRLSEFAENLRQNVASGWQTINQFLAEENNTQLAWRFRLSSETSNPREIQSPSLTPEEIRDFIDRIYSSTDEHRRKQAAEALAEVRFRDERAIEALVYLTRNSQNEETRWAAAESLWATDPDNPAANIRMIKDLGMLLSGYPVALMAAMLEKENGKIAILLRLYPLRGQQFLPAGLRLTVLDENGNNFLEAEARAKDNYIQLKFSGDRGERFSTLVALGEARITEDFEI